MDINDLVKSPEGRHVVACFMHLPNKQCRWEHIDPDDPPDVVDEKLSKNNATSCQYELYKLESREQLQEWHKGLFDKAINNARIKAEKQRIADVHKGLDKLNVSELHIALEFVGKDSEYKDYIYSRLNSLQNVCMVSINEYSKIVR